MNYTFNERTPGWREDRKEELARYLSEFFQLNRVPDGSIDFALPYIEIDRLYSGVSMRHLSKVEPNVAEWITSQADRIYREVMELDYDR